MSCQARDVFAGDPSLNVTGRLGSESWAHVLTISPPSLSAIRHPVFSRRPWNRRLTVSCLVASRRSQCDSFVWWCVCNELFNV